MEKAVGEIRDTILRHAAELPRQQRLIADYILDHTTAIPFVSVPDLARRAGVSEATVVRFAQRLGYSGFTELKMAVVDVIEQGLEGSEAELSDDEPTESVLDAVASLEVNNIRRTVGGLDQEVFGRAARAVAQAEHVYACGVGISSFLVDLLCYALRQIGIRAVALTGRGTSPREPVVLMTEGDLVIGVSLPPYSRQTLDVMEAAAERGVGILAVTDRISAPAARMTDLVLVVKSDNLMFTNAVAAVGVLANALAAQAATVNRERALHAIAGINHAIASESTVVGPTD
jgi:DNA-binding MurR/RpiR family transcriptional regulator